MFHLLPWRAWLVVDSANSPPKGFRNCRDFASNILWDSKTSGHDSWSTGVVVITSALHGFQAQYRSRSPVRSRRWSSKWIHDFWAFATWIYWVRIAGTRCPARRLLRYTFYIYTLRPFVCGCVMFSRTIRGNSLFWVKWAEPRIQIRDRSEPEGTWLGSVYCRIPQLQLRKWYGLLSTIFLHSSAFLPIGSILLRTWVIW